jgi:hypothetical protein
VAGRESDSSPICAPVGRVANSLLTRRPVVDPTTSCAVAGAGVDIRGVATSRNVINYRKDYVSKARATPVHCAMDGDTDSAQQVSAFRQEGGAQGGVIRLPVPSIQPKPAHGFSMFSMHAALLAPASIGHKSSTMALTTRLPALKQKPRCRSLGPEALDAPLAWLAKS